MKRPRGPARSFVEVAPDHPFPLQNLPYGVFSPQRGGPPRAGVAIGGFVLDLALIEREGLLHIPGDPPGGVFAGRTLNAFMALGRPAWTAVRAQLLRLLDADEPRLRDDAALRGRALHPFEAVTLHLPVAIGDYTDFYSSREHATNVGVMFRGRENALMPNWLHLPVAYHGRASSIVPSGTPVRRPRGQVLPDAAGQPVFAATGQLDFELELGFFAGPGNAQGEPIPAAQADEHVFGFVLVNDWSARDIQKWEYQPLGPFLAKNFATSISPWIVTAEALAPFRRPGPAQDPEPLPYLRRAADWSLDIRLEVLLETARSGGRLRIAESNARHLYWDVAQQLAHHTIGGCPLRPGDLLASGTISGPGKTARGSLLELTWRGTEPLELPGGERRTFLEDGDRLTITGWCEGDGYRVGFGEVTGEVLPALPEAP